MLGKLLLFECIDRKYDQANRNVIGFSCYANNHMPQTHKVTSSLLTQWIMHVQVINIQLIHLYTRLHAYITTVSKNNHHMHYVSKSIIQHINHLMKTIVNTFPHVNA